MTQALAFILQLPDIPDTGTSMQSTWIGFASVVVLTILGIVRQELSARRSQQIITKKTEETKDEVKEQLSTGVIEQTKQAVEHVEELKNLIKENTAVIGIGDSMARENHYDSAAAWREYVDKRIDMVNEAIDRMTMASQTLEETTRSLEAKIDELGRRIPRPS